MPKKRRRRRRRRREKVFGGQEILRKLDRERERQRIRKIINIRVTDIS